MLYAIADLHLSLGTNKPMDVFHGWKDYIPKLEKNWREIVSDKDTVVIAGDISWAMRINEAYNDFKFINDLPGEKVILKGNHDYWWSTKNKVCTYLKDNNFHSISLLFNSTKEVPPFAICGTRGWSYDCSSSEDIKILNREVGRLRFSIEKGLETGLEPIVFLHYPPIFSGYECKEIMNVLEEYKIKKCYYGHIHGNDVARKAIEGYYKGINFKMISCDQINFTPILVK